MSECSQFTSLFVSGCGMIPSRLPLVRVLRRARREVVVMTTVTGSGVEVAVSDTGHGIPPAVASKLFTPFVTTKARGLGLGLAISRSIIENHGGRLWMMPNAGVGTTFRFSLPILPARAELAMAADIDAVRPPGSRLH